MGSHAASAVIAISSSIVHRIGMITVGLDVSIGESVSLEGVGVRAFDSGIPVTGQRHSCVPRAGVDCSTAATTAG